LIPWPVPEPENGISWETEPQTEAELAAVRRSVNRGRPFGSDEWVEMVVRQLGLQATMRPRGRPRKEREMMKEL
jgi:putative transposase